jgi:hypothetical protein
LEENQATTSKKAKAKNPSKIFWAKNDFYFSSFSYQLPNGMIQNDSKSNHRRSLLKSPTCSTTMNPFRFW